MDIDIPTLALVNCLADVLLFVILILQYRVSKNYQGPGWWALGIASTATGVLLLLFQNFTDIRLITIILANILIVIGGFLIYIGTVKFVGKRENVKVLLLILLVLIVALVGFTYANDNISARIAVVSLSLGIVSCMTARVLLVYKTAAIRNSAIFSSIVLSAFGFIFLIRTVDALFFTSIDNLFTQGWFQLYTFLTIFITHILLTFGLVFMLNQRLQGEILEARESLAQSRQLYQTFINSTPDLVFLKDGQLRYQMINDAQSAFFGKPESEVLGKTDYELMPADAADHCTHSDLAVFDTNQMLISDEKVGDLIYETRKFPVRLDNGKTGVGAFIRNITEARRAEEALNREKYLMDSLMNNLPDYIYFKDIESRFIRINKAHSDSFGLSAPGAEIGKTDFDFFTEEHASAAYQDEQKIIQTGKPLRREERETWPDRPDTWLSTIKLPLLNQDGAIVGTFGISRDIGERKKAEAEIELKNRQLEQVIGEKDKLFSIIAHDLRSPFHALLGLTELMADETEKMTPVDMRKAAGLIRKSANSLNNQLDNLLEWSRIQMKVVSINRVDLDLSLAVNTELELFSEAAKQKRIELINLISGTIHVFADKQMLSSILRNLIANAIKFTKPHGAVTLTANWTTGNVAEISVTDTGIGMNPDILNRLFNLSSEVYRRGTEGEPSSGLGLMICKELVEKHRGQIWVESEEGIGSTFRFTLNREV